MRSGVSSQKLQTERGEGEVPPGLPPASTPCQTGSCQHIENLVIKLASIAPLGIKYSRVIKENILPRGTELNVKRGCEWWILFFWPVTTLPPRKKGQVNLNKVSWRDRDKLTRQLLQLAQKIILNYNDDKIFSPDISQALSASLSVCHSPPSMSNHNTYYKNTTFPYFHFSKCWSVWASIKFNYKLLIKCPSWQWWQWDWQCKYKILETSYTR